MKRIVMTLALIFTLSLLYTGCREEKKTPDEKIEAALEEVNEDIENASDDVKDAVEDVQDEIEEIKEEAADDSTNDN